MAKSPNAFRTISEVATWLGTQAHVLRFWESKFGAVSPVQRTGGRRYYRQSDMTVLGGIKFLLHEQRMTIRAVQKLFKDEGVLHVQSFSPRIDSWPLSNSLKKLQTEPLPVDPIKSNKIVNYFHVNEVKAPIIAQQVVICGDKKQLSLFSELELQPVNREVENTNSVSLASHNSVIPERILPQVFGASLPKMDPTLETFKGKTGPIAYTIRLPIYKRQKIVRMNKNIIEQLLNLQQKISA